MRWLVLLLVACNVPDRAPRRVPRDPTTLRFSSKDAIATLDPAIAYDEQSTWITHALYDTLVDYAPASTTVIPRLAERWDVSPDGRTYHFWLRPGAAYADGRPIVAADFKRSFERTRAMPDSPFGPYLAPLSQIEVVNDRELVLHLEHADATFLYVLTMTFTTPLPGDVVASGPYMVELWDPGQRIVLRRNPHYVDPTRAHVQRIEMLENIPRDTQFLMFERGELDTAERLAPPDYLYVTDQAAWQPFVHTTPQMNAYGIRMNVRQKPFDDRRVRQALNYALDKDHTIKLLNGGAVAAHGILPPGMPGRDDALRPYPHDVAKARALLAEAGYPHGFDVDFITLDDEEAQKLAASIQADLGEAGVRVHITTMSVNALQTAMGRPDGPPFTYDAWVGDFPDPSNFLEPRFSSRMIADENSNNTSFYSNPALDALLDAAHGEPDAGRRAEEYRRAERILYDDAPWIWNYHREMTEVTQPYVHGYAPHPVWGRDYTSTSIEVPR